MHHPVPLWARSWKLEMDLSASDRTKLNDVGCGWSCKLRWLTLQPLILQKIQTPVMNEKCASKSNCMLHWLNIFVQWASRVPSRNQEIYLHMYVRGAENYWWGLFFLKLNYLFVVWCLKWSFLPYWNAFRNIFPPVPEVVYLLRLKGPLQLCQI